MTEKMTFSELQQKVQVSKSGKPGIKYSFRNAEEIFTKIKKIGSGWVVTASDELFEMGGRIFVKAVAKAEQDGEVHEATAFAELDSVPVFKGGVKQMQAPQWSGAVSSYARKYALQGLFGIGEEDIDGYEYDDQPQQQAKSQQELVSSEEYGKVLKGIEKLSQVSGQEFANVLATVQGMANVNELKFMPKDMYADCLKWLADEIKKAEAQAGNNASMNLENM